MKGEVYPACPVARREVRLGAANRVQLLEHLERAGVLLNEFARVLFASEDFVVVGKPRSVTTIELAVRNLGFPRGARMPELISGAVALGLSLPELEVGPWLVLQHRSGAEDGAAYAATKGTAPPGSITVASAPIRADDTFPKGFYLRWTGGTPALRGYLSDDEHLWQPEDRLLFVTGAS